MTFKRDSRTLWERAETKFTVTEGCWEWTGAKCSGGYGHMWHPDTKKLIGAHRLVYELLVGPIPDGMELDHLCRNIICVRPDHLEPVNHRENVMRGQSLQALNAKKTHCPKGHPYDEVNTYHWSGATGASRACRTCTTRKKVT